MNAPKTVAPTRYILPAEMKPAKYGRTEYRVSPTRALTVADLKRPESWAHLALLLKQGDLIEVVDPAARWYVPLLVRHIEGQKVHVGVLNEVNFAALPTIGEIEAA